MIRLAAGLQTKAVSTRSRDFCRYRSQMDKAEYEAQRQQIREQQLDAFLEAADDQEIVANRRAYFLSAGRLVDARKRHFDRIVKREPERVKGIDTEEIYSLIWQRGSATVAELIQESGMKPWNLHVRLRALLSERKIERADRGLYRVAHG